MRLECRPGIVWWWWLQESGVLYGFLIEGDIPGPALSRFGGMRLDGVWLGTCFFSSGSAATFLSGLQVYLFRSHYLCFVYLSG